MLLIKNPEDIEDSDYEEVVDMLSEVGGGSRVTGQVRAVLVYALSPPFYWWKDTSPYNNLHPFINSSCAFLMT